MSWRDKTIKLTFEWKINIDITNANEQMRKLTEEAVKKLNSDQIVLWMNAHPEKIKLTPKENSIQLVLHDFDPDWTPYKGWKVSR